MTLLKVKNVEHNKTANVEHNDRSTTPRSTNVTNTTEVVANPCLNNCLNNSYNSKKRGLARYVHQDDEKFTQYPNMTRHNNCRLYQLTTTS